MPIRDIIISETSNMILDPIAKQMTYIVLTRLGMNGLFNNNIYITNDYTKPSLTSDGDTHNVLISKDRCDVKMNFSMNPTEMKWDVNSFKYTQSYGVVGVRDKILRPVFEDRIANVNLVEHQLPCTMILEFSLQFKDRENSFKAISAINNTSLKDSVVNFHDLVYEYPVGEDLEASLRQTFELRKVGLANPDFNSYLVSNSNNAIQFIQQRTGNKTELVVKRQDIQVYGVLEYNQQAPGVQEIENSMDRFTVDFTYTIQFARPDVLRLYFPVVIENQMVPTWMLRVQQENYLALVYGFFQERGFTSYLRSQLTNIKPTIRMPCYDDFRPPLQPVVACKFEEIFDSVLLLEPQGTPTTVDLNNLGVDISLNPIVLDIIALQGNEIFQTKGIFNITVYCNEIPVSNSLLSIDENLVVTINMSNPSKRYHFVLSEATDLKYLDKKWIPTLIKYRTFFPITIIRNFQYLQSIGYCYLDTSNALINLIQTSSKNFTLDNQISTLIEEGHLTHYAYSHTVTPEQFASYLMDTISPVTNTPAWNAYANLSVKQGLITSDQLGTGYVKTKEGYPFLPQDIRGTVGISFNMPFRVQQTTININRQEG